MSQSTVQKNTQSRKIVFSDDSNLVTACLDVPSDAGSKVMEKIDELQSEEVALWGVSVFVYRLLTHTHFKNCNLKLLVDGNPHSQGQHIMGLTIHSPDRLKEFDGTIVVSGRNSAQSIKKAIKDMGLKNKVVYLMADE